MSLDIKMSFIKFQILPSEFSTIFELETNIDPSLKFAGSFNQKHNDDLIRFIPQSVFDQIKAQEFDIDIPLNTLGIETLPAKVKVSDINIPTTIEANLSKESNLTYDINGKLKVGYIVDIKGPIVKTTPIYENTIKATVPSALELHGEVLISSEIVIVPEIYILDKSYKVSGDINMGFKTETNGHISLPGQAPIFGTKGVFTSSMNVEIDLFITKIPVQIFNNEKVLWEKGTLDRTVTYSDLTWNLSSKYAANLLAGTRAYETNFNLNYKYPILGKISPNELFISYEVYQKNGKTRLETVNNLSIKPSNITANSFSFKLNIPYKKNGGILSSSYENESYLRNLVIKDSRGYIYEGILNTSNNIVENNFLLRR